MGKTLQQTGIPVPLLVAYSLKLAEEWHPTKNVKFQRDEIPFNSSYRAWWRCRRDARHEWQAQVATRAREKQGCPFCSGRKVLPGDSIAHLYPEVAAEFHPTKNGDLRPENFAPRSNKRLWWLCSTNQAHAWETTVANRTSGSQCPDCRKLANSLARNAPEVAEEWHATRNGDLTPEMLPSSSPQKVWWQCRLDPQHEWQVAIATRTRGLGQCPGCRKSKREDNLTLKTHSHDNRGLEESAPELLPFWDTSKNGSLRPQDFSCGSTREVWWLCPSNSAHSWKAPINQVHRRKNTCLMCHGGRNPGSVRREDSLGYLYPNLLAEWHPTQNGSLDPMSISPGSRIKPFWQCTHDPEHVWQSFVFLRKKGSKCPFCRGTRVDSKTCLAAVEPEIAATWHPTKNGVVTPKQVSRQSATKRWWQCDINPDHEWNESVQNRVNRRQCPKCREISRQQDLETALARTISENVTSFATFTDSIDSLAQLALLTVSDNTLRQVLYRQVYAGVVASMETYLSDTFINVVVEDKDLRNRFARATPEFADRKFKLDELIDWEQSSETKIRKHLVNQVFHNLPKVGPLFEKVLKIRFPIEDDFVELLKIVNARHNIVHRNGRNKHGSLLELCVTDIESTISRVRAFVEDIDRQAAQSPWQ